MSAAEKYGRSISSLSAESLSQARAAGQSLADSGVALQSSLGNMTPAHTPAMKYGAPVSTHAMSRSLSHEAQRSL
jgi:hypothetical protein